MNLIRKIFLLIIVSFIGLTGTFGQNTSRLDSIIELGDDLLSLNDLEAAEQRYDQALEMKESYPPAIEAKVKILMMQEKYSKASKILDDALSTHPNHAPFYIYESDLLMQKENYIEALQQLNKALQLTDKESNPDLLSKIYVNRGAAYQKLDQSDNALDDYSKALEINNQNPNVYVYRGYLYYKQDRFDEAIADFEKVLDLDPNNHYAQYNIGMSHFKLGNKLKACDAFHKACELGNKNACKMVISKCLRGGGN